jgi:hypothetical protein
MGLKKYFTILAFFSNQIRVNETRNKSQVFVGISLQADAILKFFITGWSRVKDLGLDFD